MEVKPGYKQTEVGVIPEDWGVEVLDSVAKRGSGHTPDKAHPEYWGGTIKWVSLQDSDRLDRLYITDTAAKITPAGIANSSARMHSAGTVVLSRDAGVGKSAIMSEDMAVSQHFMAWKCGPLLDNHFLYYWLQTRKSEFERIAMGNTIKTIGLPYFRKLSIPLPPTKAEQEAIAEALSDADALIESLEQLLAKKRYVKQGAMQELLTGKKRLPGFATSSGYKRTEVGVIPEDWTLSPLAECASRITDGEHITPRRTASGYYLLSARNILNGRIDLSDVDYVGESEYRRIRQRCKPEPGDVLISCSGTVGRVATVPEELECVMVRSAALVKPNPDLLNGRYGQYFLQSSAGQKQINETLNQGAQANLFLNHIENLRIALPRTKSEQTAIAEVLSDMDAEIAALETQLAKARQIKQGMMQELLTGRIRLV